MKQTIVDEKVQKWKKNLLKRASGKDGVGGILKGRINPTWKAKLLNIICLLLSQSRYYLIRPNAAGSKVTTPPEYPVAALERQNIQTALL
jgi:hypothetical protein